tara:strand:+ start:118 stop:873 length:756 start_codon:yes stop_codon:yes gene_type:complete
MIYWNGCSFVVGSEVKERPRDTFAGLVGTHFMTPWWQNAKVGGSNDRIWRTTMDDMIRQPADLVIIVWSGLNRFEYLNEKNNTWRSAVWVRHRMNKATLKITDDSEVHFHPDMSLEQWKGLQGYASKIRNARYNLITSLNYMISIKYFLKQKGIPYLFYNMSDGQIHPSRRILNEDRKEGANTVWEVKHIKEKEYYNELPHLKEEAFYDMCKRAKVPFGAGDHPLEDGHKLMAKRIIQDIYKYGYDKIINK